MDDTTLRGTGRGECRSQVRAVTGHSDPVVRSLSGRIPEPREQAALTVLQPLGEFRALQQWCTRTGNDIGRPVLSPQDVLHALIVRLLADARLAADVVADLREDAGVAEVSAYAGW